MAKKKVISRDSEYGFRTPNGEEFFPTDTVNPHRGPSVPFERLETESGQELAQSRYKGVLRNQGIPEEGNELEFIQRVRTVSLSPVIPLPPQGGNPFDEEDEEVPRSRLSSKPVRKPNRPF
ncbi:hypothetical protein SEA_MAGRITTE_74 [Microbacterium phage Magritte]|nr:hypothetical protein SEA_MAGRITTE_74 [Microbacterium phage Magritte]